MSQKDAQNYLQEYSIKLGPGDDPNNPASEQRGVLVIKSKSKTKAKQRKGAVANWKVISHISAFLSLLHFMCVRYGLICEQLNSQRYIPRVNASRINYSDVAPD